MLARMPSFGSRNTINKNQELITASKRSIELVHVDITCLYQESLFLSLDCKRLSGVAAAGCMCANFRRQHCNDNVM